MPIQNLDTMFSIMSESFVLVKVKNKDILVTGHGGP
jgi:hypothetical protein